MEQSDLLRLLVGALEQLRIPYFITGSVATVFYGEPRFTNDVDAVVALPHSAVDDFVRAFPPDEFYVSDAAAKEAVERARQSTDPEGTQFNIIHPASGLKM